MATVVQQSDTTKQAVLMVDDEGYLLVAGVGGGANPQELTECQTERSRLQAELLQAQQALNALNANIQQMIQEQEQELAALKSKEEQLRDLLERQAQGQQGLEGQIAALQDELTTARQRVKDLEQQIKDRAGEVRTIVVEKPVWTLNEPGFRAYSKIQEIAASLPETGDSVLLVFPQRGSASHVKPAYVGGNPKLVSNWEEFYPRPGYAFPSPAWDVTGKSNVKLKGSFWALTAEPFAATRENPGVRLSLGFDQGGGPETRTFQPNREIPEVIHSYPLSGPTYPSNDGTRTGKVVNPYIQGGPPISMLFVLFETVPV